MDRRGFLIGMASAAATVAAGGAALADQPAVFTGLVPGVGAGGYDVVAYFAEARARKGDASITAEYEGVTYRFASKADRATFQSDPARYLPQFGGYCAYAVAEGATAKGEPESWTVTGGKLYLNYSKQVRTLWRQDIAKNISRATANWPDVLKK
jgi:YHS domain-containing protein